MVGISGILRILRISRTVSHSHNLETPTQTHWWYKLISGLYKRLQNCMRYSLYTEAVTLLGEILRLNNRKVLGVSLHIGDIDINVCNIVVDYICIGIV